MQHQIKSLCKPVAMTVAGSDNSAGAGIQADLKTFAAHGVYGLTCVTCVVAEVPGLVERVEPVSPAMLAAQIRLGFDAFPVGAVKTGMLFSCDLVLAAVEALHKAGCGRSRAIPLVVDPVMVASSGDPLLEDDAINAYRCDLLPMATVITPNLDEAGVLLGRSISHPGEMPDAARKLFDMFGAAILLKGGHLQTESALDLLFDGKNLHEFTAPFRRGVSTHGTGCTFSAAITAGLAQASPLDKAVADAKAHVTRAIENILQWPRPDNSPTMALDHFA